MIYWQNFPTQWQSVIAHDICSIKSIGCERVDNNCHLVGVLGRANCPLKSNLLCSCILNSGLDEFHVEASIILESYLEVILILILFSSWWMSNTAQLLHKLSFVHWYIASTSMKTLRWCNELRHCLSWMYHTANWNMFCLGNPESAWGSNFHQLWWLWQLSLHQGSDEHHIQMGYVPPWYAAWLHRPMECHSPLSWAWGEGLCST